MPVTNSVKVVVVFVVVSYSINASKVDKKSDIYAHHHEQKCGDYKAVASKCHMWKDLGFCFKHRKEMEFVCSKTCKFCDPGETHWTYTAKPDENAKTKTIIETPNKPSPVVEVMGKKKALYLSSNDIAGMLQTLSSQNFGVTEKPTPKPKELAVIQGRIQKVEPVVMKTDAKGQMKIKPTISVGGKLQTATKPVEKEDSSGKDKGRHDAKAEDKNKERQNNVENKLLGLMSQIIRGGAGEKEKKPKDNASEKSKAEPLNIPEIMNILQNLKEKVKTDKENPVKEKQATEQKPSDPNATSGEQKVNTTENQVVDAAKNKAILAAMKLFKAVGPVGSASKGNQSSLMEQLTAAAEEASVALKLLNKTGSVDKVKEAKVPSGLGNIMYNVKLLQEELNKANKNNSNVITPIPVLETNATANTSKMAVVNVSSSNPQLSEFILRLQDSITNPQGKESSLSSSVNGRGGVASRKEEGKPTLSEIIPFNIKVDDAESETTGNSKSETPIEGTTKPDTKPTYQSDEEKIMKILDGLDQDDKPTKVQDKGSSAKDVVMQIREAYDDLGEIVNGVEVQVGIKKEKKKKEDREGEEETEQSSEEKKKKEEKKDEKDSKDEKEKKGKDEGKDKKKKDGDDDDDDDHDDNAEDGEFFDPSAKPKPKKKKPLTKEQHLEQVLSLIKKAGHHLEMIGAKRVKMAGKPQDSSDEDASMRSADSTNNNYNQADWKTLATRLARQLGLVLKKMAEKDEKYKAERNRLKSVLAALAQTELSTRHNDEDTNEDGDDEGDDDYNQNDSDRSKIIHNMATKLLKFSKTISAVQKSSEGKPVRKKKKVLHNLISRYRSLVTKILNNWKKLKGKKKSGIPRRKGKRGEIVRGKNGNHTAKAIQESPGAVKVNQTDTKSKQTAQDTIEKEKPMASKAIQSARLAPVAEAKKMKKKAENKEKKKEKEKEKKKIEEEEATKKETITPVADDEQDVIEIVHK